MEEKFSKHLRRAQELLNTHKGTPLGHEAREKEAVELASLMLQEANRIQTHGEKKSQAEIARMMEDPRGKAFTMMMTDEGFRSSRTKRVADQLVYLLENFGAPRYVDWTKRIQLQAFKVFGKAFHFLLVPLAKQALRKTTSQVILPGERAALSAHMEKRRQQGVRINLNHLGEAILGEEEAVRRLNLYLRDLEQDDVEYVSIKISTIYSQINVLDWDHTLEILADRLRQLYRKAKNYRFKRADGAQVVKFVNLDMEEYKDLHLTKELFKKVLDEEEFLNYSGGIVLQAYLPDSYPIQQELTEWAMSRKKRGGAPVKIRIVKGANLAMEQFEASLRNWHQTPYKTKEEVDANYKRMVLYGCQKRHAEAVHLGIASHNLFDIAFSMLARIENGVEHEVTYEMLEGMADHMRRVVQHLTGEILLYCPVATKGDFQSAIAYLIRRLDENTGAENFLRHSFGLKPGTDVFKDQAELFLAACKDVDSVSASPRRQQNRFDPPKHLDMSAPFEIEPDTDYALPQNQQWAHAIMKEWKEKTFDPIPLVIGGKELHRDEKGSGEDPGNPSEKIYAYSLASWEDIDEALKVAKNTEAEWGTKSPRERAELLSAVARKMRERRAELTGVMMRDGGKAIFETEAEISEAIDFAEYYLRSMLEFDGMKELELSPLGTILVAPPWNFPVSIPAGGICAALITGNCVLFKPAPEAVLSSWILVQLFWDAGIPKNVLQFINCVDEPVGSKLIQDPRVNAVILTGGTPTARLFMKMRPDLHLSAETGGKNALIITGMSDRDLAIKDLIQSAFGHSGQKCSAASLAILEAEVYDDPHFRRQLKDAVESLHVGSCWDPSSKVIPLIRPPGKELKQGFTTLAKGEKWLVEPKQDPNNPNLWSPGVKWGVKEGSFMHQTELFGPVLGVMRAKDLDEAIRFANGTMYGLTSGIHSLDKREIDTWTRQIEAGNCYINRGTTGAIVQRQPFGGCKASSFGHGSKAGGPNYLTQFMHKKQVALPKDKSPVPQEVNILTTFLEGLELSAEQLGEWFASASNYAFFAKHFARDHDPSLVLGQDNILRFVPRKNMALRIQHKDAPLNVLRILAAALCCKTHLTVSYDPKDCPISLEKDALQSIHGLNFCQESEEEFLQKLENKSYDRIRLAAPPSETMRKVAAQHGIYLNAEPVLASGRIELTNYLREVAISHDYHRYGNLGVREGEIRSEIL
jgi:RHH-type transcriptional regulator, proline utilization regulon repressor / proline dehydrogenase / delta 1-pyrroline-5-carboxylate dehydrogenase